MSIARRFGILCAVLLAVASPAFASPLTTDYASYNLFGGPPGGFTTSGLYDAVDPYMVGAQPWQASLSPTNATYLSAPTSNFTSVLENAYGAEDFWTFADTATELSDNSLVLHTYDVLGTAGSVGAEFHLSYDPHGSDPITDLHWIQVYTNNHNLDGYYSPTGHGQTGNNVDNAASPSHRVPYYDDGYAATFGDVAANNPIFFYDFSSREGNFAHEWMAELWLVQGPSVAVILANQAAFTYSEITLLGGVQWGWINAPVPEPASMALLAIGLAVIAGRQAVTKKAGP